MKRAFTQATPSRGRTELEQDLGQDLGPFVPVLRGTEPIELAEAGPEPALPPLAPISERDEDHAWHEALRRAAEEAALDADWRAAGVAETLRLEAEAAIAAAARLPNHGYDSAVTVISSYVPGRAPVEITIFAPIPDAEVDVDLQPASRGLGTEVLIGGRLRAVLTGVLPYDVDPTDLMIEFAG
ncbi:hypothetical protein [Frigidibacter sp. MR17.24]|uniref:hypothetical protein n=1 Tax=Frigidibacter sp. MR17.24 TaxID=3127345 RepID=UPI0030130046